MTYYAMAAAAVVLFSLQFWFNDRYQKHRGSAAKAAVVFSLGSNIAGFVTMLIINRFRLEYTPFSLIMAVAVALDGLGFLIFSLKAFSVINLSLYSVFSMLGGMTLPFILGLSVYREPFTAGKCCCFAFTAAALALTVKKGTQKKGYFYYAGIFILNGLSGVIAKIFQATDLPKVSNAGFSALSAAVGAVLSGVLLLFVQDKTKTALPDASGKPALPAKLRSSLRPLADMTAYGAVNRFANFLVLVSLWHLPASAQAPFISGGVIICSTLIAFVSKQKPTGRELAAVALASTGIALLMVFG